MTKSSRRRPKKVPPSTSILTIPSTTSRGKKLTRNSAGPSVPTSPEAQSPKVVATPASKRKGKGKATSGSSSSLSPASVQSPAATVPTESLPALAREHRSTSPSSIDSHQPPPAPSIMQHQTFGADPLNFDDPTIYHIRKVTDDMTEDEKKEIYGVASFPHDDLSDLIPGTPPDKDFSNAKPSNQVNSNTYAAYIEPYLRPLVEEDVAFLRERVKSNFQYDTICEANLSRVTVLLLSRYRLVPKGSTTTSGPKRTVQCRPMVLQIQLDVFIRINHGATSIISTTKQRRQIKSPWLLLQAVSYP